MRASHTSIVSSILAKSFGAQLLQTWNVQGLTPLALATQNGALLRNQLFRNVFRDC